MALKNITYTALDVQCLVTNCLNVPFMDVAAVFTLQETLLKLQDNNIKTALILKPRHMEKIKNLIDKEIINKVSLCTSVNECKFQK